MIIKGLPVPCNCHQCDSWGLSDVVGIDCPVDKDGSLYSYHGRPEGCPLFPIKEMKDGFLYVKKDGMIYEAQLP